jgi:DNA-binding transcriptional regulator YiaG
METCTGLMHMKPTHFAAIRQKYGLSMEQLAGFLGLTKAAVSRYESGGRHIPGPVERLMRLLDEGGEKFFAKISAWG